MICYFAVVTNLENSKIIVFWLLSIQRENKSDWKWKNAEYEITETLDNFFSKIVKKLEIPKHDSNDLVTKNIENLVFIVTLKYKNHPSIHSWNSKIQQNKWFHFEVEIGKIEKESLKLLKKNYRFPLGLLWKY